MLPNNNGKHTPTREIKERPNDWRPVEGRYLKAVDSLQKDLLLSLKST